MKAKATLIGILLVTGGLTAGCLGMDETSENATNLSSTNDSSTNDSLSSASTGANQTPADGNESTDAANASTQNQTLERTLNATASTTNGTAPLPVTFSLNATGFQGNQSGSWVLAFGDGNQTNGTSAELPTSVNHTYNATGNLTAVFNVTYEDGDTRNETINLTIVPGEDETTVEPGWHHETRSGTVAGVSVAGAALRGNALSSNYQTSWSVPQGAKTLFLNLSVSWTVGGQAEEQVVFYYGHDCQTNDDCSDQATTGDSITIEIDNPASGDWGADIWPECTACADSADYTLEIAAFVPG